nr:TSUP family transporter [Desulfuromonadales bacterium]
MALSTRTSLRSKPRSTDCLNRLMRAKSLTLGLAAGVIGGLFGVGGGLVIVPGLVLWLGFEQRR